MSKTTINVDIDIEPPSTMALTLNAQSMLNLTYEDIERLPLIVLRRLWACQKRHHQELAEALDTDIRRKANAT
jgi:hypothetical protein